MLTLAEEIWFYFKKISKKFMNFADFREFYQFCLSFEDGSSNFRGN